MDYPAAHSMDTTWFAVDADGHVAMLDSQSDGLVPSSYLRAFGTQTYLELLTSRAPRDDYGNATVDGDALAVQRRCSPSQLVDAVDAAVRATRGTPNEGAELATILDWHWVNAFLVLREPSVVTELPAEDIVAFREDPKVVYVDCRLRAVWEAFTRGRVLGAHLIGSHDYDQDSDLASAMGLYVFGHANPHYQRVRVPTRPLMATALPADLRPRLPTLPVSFAAMTKLQPPKYVPCEGLGWNWQSVPNEPADFDEARGDEDAAPQDEDE